MDLPLRLLKPFLGARIIKTGLAVFLALVGLGWVGHDYAVFSAVAAILAVQPSLRKARELFVHQLLGNVAGGLIGMGLVYWFGSEPYMVALGVIVLLGILAQLGLADAANIAVVVLLFVMESTEQNLFLYVAARVGAITSGMLIGFLINRFIRPPRFSGRLREELQMAGREVDTFIGHLIGSLPAPEFFHKEQIKQEVAAIQKRLDQVRYLLDVSRGADDDDPWRPALVKANTSMYVFSERIADIHKTMLNAGALSGAEERGLVATALGAAMRYRQEAMTAALEGRHPESGAAEAFEAAMAELYQMVEMLVDDPQRRPVGMSLYTIYGHIRHMGERMLRLSELIPPRS